jgi:phage replication O-like protein O
LLENASPQLENGHTRISNELLEAIIKCHFCATELNIIWFIARNTYGWQRKEAIISYGMIAKGIDADIRYVKRMVNRLIKNGVIFKEKIDNQNLLGLNKNYKSWRLWITDNLDIQKTTSTVVF